MKGLVMKDLVMRDDRAQYLSPAIALIAMLAFFALGGAAIFMAMLWAYLTYAPELGGSIWSGISRAEQQAWCLGVTALAAVAWYRTGALLARHGLARERVHTRAAEVAAVGVGMMVATVSTSIPAAMAVSAATVVAGTAITFAGSFLAIRSGLGRPRRG